MKKRLIIDSGQFEKFDAKLLEIANNLLNHEDILVRKHYWEERLIVYQGWDGWNYEKSFLPEDFYEYDQVKKEVKEKVWIEKKEGDKSMPGYPRYPRTQKGAIEDREKIKEWNEQYKEKPELQREFDDGAFELEHENPNTGSQWSTFNVKRGKNTLTRKYFRYNCYLLSDQNNIKRFVFQNEHQNDFSRPDIVIFFRGSLYWKTDYKVVDTQKLYVVLTCKRDVPWLYHKQVMSRPGTANIVRSQLTRYRIKKDEAGKPFFNFYNKEETDPEKQWIESSADSVPGYEKKGIVNDYTNPFPDHCFSFCSDLRCEKMSGPITEIETFGSSHSGRSAEAEWQPTFGVCFADPSTFGVRKQKGANNIQIRGKDGEVLVDFPSSMKFRKYKGTSMSIFPMILFLVDGRHYEKAGEVNEKGAGGRTANPHFPSTEGDLSGDTSKAGDHFSTYKTAFTAWLPNIFNEQPHLIYHSTVQFYFMRKLLTTVELKRCKITYKGAEAKGGNPTYGDGGFGNDLKKGEIHCLKYRVRIMSSAAGITYHFESGDIFFRWDLQVQQAVQAKAMWDTIIRSWALNVDNFLSGLGVPTDTIWGNILHTGTRKIIDQAQKTFRKKFKEKVAKEAKRWAKNARSRIFVGGGGEVLGTGGTFSASVLGIADFLVGFTADLFSDEPEAEPTTLDINQTIIKKDTLKGQLGLFDSKENSSEEQNTARMKSSTENTGRLSGADATEIDRDFGSMKQTRGFEGEKEHTETIHKSIKKTTQKGTESMSLGKMNSPAHYYVNTIKMRYDVYEFYNRSISNPFEIRFDYSDQLYNSLENCNAASPAQSFDRISFSNLQQIVRRGETQADINIDFDFDNEYKNAFARGIFFRKHKDHAENFPVWFPKRAEHASGALGSVPNAIPLDSQEEVKTTDVWKDVPFEDSQGGPDNTNATRMGAWIIRKLSFITDENGKDWFEEFKSQIPSSTRHSNWIEGSRWSFKTAEAGGSSGSAPITIPGLKCRYLLTTFDGRNNVAKGEGNDITLHGATLVWTARPKGVDFELKINGTKREKITITEIIDKEVPADTFMPEIPPNIDIPGGGGTEEIPTMEDYIEQNIENEDEITMESDMSMDGLYEDITDENFQEIEKGDEESGELDDDIEITGEEEDEGEKEIDEVKAEEDYDEDQKIKDKDVDEEMSMGD